MCNNFRDILIKEIFVSVFLKMERIKNKYNKNDKIFYIYITRNTLHAETPRRLNFSYFAKVKVDYIYNIYIIYQFSQSRRSSSPVQPRNLMNSAERSNVQADT